MCIFSFYGFHELRTSQLAQQDPVAQAQTQEQQELQELIRAVPKKDLALVLGAGKKRKDVGSKGVGHNPFEKVRKDRDEEEDTEYDFEEEYGRVLGIMGRRRRGNHVHEIPIVLVHLQSYLLVFHFATYYEHDLAPESSECVCFREFQQHPVNVVVR